MQINIFGRPHLLDAPGVHHGDGIGHGERLFLIVRHEQERRPDARLQRLQFGPHLLAQLGVERGQRLVEQQHIRIHHQRPRQRDPLLLAAGKLRRAARFLAGQLDQRERLLHLALDIRRRFAPQSELHVVLHGQMRKQRVALKDRADVAVIGRPVVDASAAEQDFPWSGCSNPAIIRSVVVLPHPEGPSSE